jgi:hypothetical protein
MKRLWRDYSLSIVLGTLFLVTWALHAWTGWVHFAADQQSHGETAELLGASGYLWRWGEATFENWQSEFLQLLSFVVLTSFLVHKGSHESKDSSDAMQQSLDRIEARLREMSSAAAQTEAAPPTVATTNGFWRPASLAAKPNGAHHHGELQRLSSARTTDMGEAHRPSRPASRFATQRRYD